jgi:hypothetical protein
MRPGTEPWPGMPLCLVLMIILRTGHGIPALGGHWLTHAAISLTFACEIARHDRRMWERGGGGWGGGSGG